LRHVKRALVPFTTTLEVRDTASAAPSARPRAVARRFDDVLRPLGLTTVSSHC